MQRPRAEDLLAYGYASHSARAPHSVTKETLSSCTIMRVTPMVSNRRIYLLAGTIAAAVICCLHGQPDREQARQV